METLTERVVRIDLFKPPSSDTSWTLWQRWASAALLLVIAGVLRFYQLEGQLWLDEIAALSDSYRKSLLEIWSVFPGIFPHPLYSLLAHSSLVLFGESAWSVRLPAAVFGVAGVLMFYRLAGRLTGRGEALLASLLLAVSYHHIFFSQNARGYSLYLFLFLAATDVLLSLLSHMRWRTAFGYAGLAALTAYSQLFGLFVPIGQLLIALVVVWYGRRQGHVAQATPTPIYILSVGALTALAILLLYAPMLPAIIAYSLTTAQTPDFGPRVFELLPELLEGLRAAFGGWPGVLLGAAIGVGGTVHFFWRRPLALSVLVAPLALGALVVGVLGVGVHPRFFLLALPIGYLLATHGLVLIAQLVFERFMRLSPTYKASVQIILAVLIVLVAAYPLIRYYSIPKQDFEGALQYVEDVAGPGDQVVAVDLAGHAIQAYYDLDFPVVDTLTDLQRVEARGRPVWAITTLERVEADRDGALMRHLHENYERVLILPGSVGDGEMRIYKREAVRP